MARKRVAILISGRGSNMMALIEAANRADYPAEIALILSNRPQAAGLAAAGAIPAVLCDHTRYGADREQFDNAIHTELARYDIELVCLAGFMRVLTAGLVRQWQDRILNIHPALLPAFKGLNTHERALAAGVKIHGASVHFVATKVDAGPIIVQGAVPVLGGDTVETLAARVLKVEHRLYPLALRLVAEGRVRVVGGRCEITGARPAENTLIVPEM
jgi:phosphoribosylglycinamide formyltransferase-1